MIIVIIIIKKNNENNKIHNYETVIQGLEIHRKKVVWATNINIYYIYIYVYIKIKVVSF